MSEKNTTARKRKGTQGRSKQASEQQKIEYPDLTFEVTIGSRFGKDEKFYGWETDSLIYAGMLKDPECPQAFRQAFKNIFIDHLLTKCDPPHPGNIAGIFLLTVASLQDDAPCDADTAVEILRTLRETLAPE